MNHKKESRLRRARKARMKIREMQVQDNALARLVVTKTSRHMTAQIIVLEDAVNMKMRVVASASTMEKDVKSQCKYTGNIDAAKIVGKTVAERYKKHSSENVTKIAFDRSGYKYHGRVKALAEAARETGLDF